MPVGGGSVRNIELEDGSLKYVIIGMIATIVIITLTVAIANYQKKPDTSTHSSTAAERPVQNTLTDTNSNSASDPADSTQETKTGIHTDTILRDEHVGYDPDGNPVANPAYEYFDGISKKEIYEYIRDQAWRLNDNNGKATIENTRLADKQAASKFGITEMEAARIHSEFMTYSLATTPFMP